MDSAAPHSSEIEMKDMSEVLLGLEATIVFGKVDKLFEADPTLEGRVAAWSAEFVAKQKEQHGDISTPAARLIAYRKLIGDDAFNAIASNPKLQDIIDQHYNCIIEQNTKVAIDGLMEVFQGSLTENDVKLLLWETMKQFQV